MAAIEGHFTLAVDTYYERRWPVDAPRGHVLLVHGYGEHCARYDHVAAALNASGYSVYSYDQRWHGRSPGKKGYIANFDRLVDDLGGYLAHVRPALDGAPFFLFAHSMGCLITATYLQRNGAPQGCKGVIFSSPFFQLPDDVSPLLIKLAGVLGTYAPWLPVSSLNTDAVSRDRAVVAAYEKDPLNHHGPILARTGAQINAAVLAARAACDKITLPAYVFHGEADGLAPFAGGKYLYEHLGSTEKTFQAYPGGYHELFNDLPKEEVLRAVIAWYDAHN